MNDRAASFFGHHKELPHFSDTIRNGRTASSFGTACCVKCQTGFIHRKITQLCWHCHFVVAIILLLNEKWQGPYSKQKEEPTVRDFLQEQASPAMPPSSAILFLIVSHLFSSSASLLKAVKVSEELSPFTSMTASTIGPPVTSLNTSLTPLAALDGLVTLNRYSDSLCKNSVYAAVSGLNTCIRVDVSSYQKIIATSSSVLYSYYSDPYCLLLVSSSTIANTNSACVDGFKSFVSSSMIYTPDYATAVLR